MATWRSRSGPQWFDIFPVTEKFTLSDPSAPLLVDVGGGVGHNLVAFKQRHPNVLGKLIVQDIPVVVKNAKDLPTGVEAVVHDFFMPQPVKGAKAYLLANVLHDWPDKQALKILGNIRDAMSQDSELLIWENILPESNVPQLSAAIDLTMMANFSAGERTLAQYSTLLEKAGFKLVKAWTPGGVLAPVSGGQTLLEAAVKQGVA